MAATYTMQEMKDLHNENETSHITPPTTPESSGA